MCDGSVTNGDRTGDVNGRWVMGALESRMQEWNQDRRVLKVIDKAAGLENILLRIMTERETAMEFDPEQCVLRCHASSITSDHHTHTHVTSNNESEWARMNNCRIPDCSKSLQNCPVECVSTNETLQAFSTNDLMWQCTMNEWFLWNDWMQITILMQLWILPGGVLWELVLHIEKKSMMLHSWRKLIWRMNSFGWKDEWGYNVDRLGLHNNQSNSWCWGWRWCTHFGWWWIERWVLSCDEVLRNYRYQNSKICCHQFIGCRLSTKKAITTTIWLKTESKLNQKVCLDCESNTGPSDRRCDTLCRDETSVWRSPNWAIKACEGVLPPLSLKSRGKIKVYKVWL